MSYNEEIAQNSASPHTILKNISIQNDVEIQSREFALFMDKNDPLKFMRDRFHYPKKMNFGNTDASLVSDLNEDCIYLCGNSLGLQPKETEAAVMAQIRKWAAIGVETHFVDPLPAASCDNYGRESLGRLVGANSSSVVLMNGLTVNLNLLLISFYQPDSQRYKILIEKQAFPSDRYSVRSQAQIRGYNKDDAILEIGPKDGEEYIRTEDVLQLIEEEGESIAVICLSGVQYYTGQKFDMETITRAGQAKGCFVGWDLAHAIGNVEIQLDKWNVDFACWCTYKYMNSGPGCIAGAYVNKMHNNRSVPHLHGWWSNKEETRFLMQDECDCAEGVDGFKLCNPPPLLISCVLSSLQIFDEAGMEKILHKQYLLTGYLEYLINHLCDELNDVAVKIITPRHPKDLGCQLSLVFSLDLHQVHKELKRRGIICDIRLPNVMRIAPAPLYNSFCDVYDFVRNLKNILFGLNDNVRQC